MRFPRTVRHVLTGIAVLLAVVGVGAAPAAVLVIWVLVVSFGAPVVAVHARDGRPDATGSTVRHGAVLVVLAAGAAATLVGAFVLLGPAVTALVAAATAGAGAWWGWRRRGSVPPGPSAARPTGPDPVGTAPARPAGPGRPRSVDRGPAPAWRTARDAVTLPATPVTAMATGEICGAWQRSFWLLSDVAGPRQWAVVLRRGELLDELERRDPAGFARWLRTEPRPVSNPGRFLTADS